MANKKQRKLAGENYGYVFGERYKWKPPTPLKPEEYKSGEIYENWGPFGEAIKQLQYTPLVLGFLHQNTPPTQHTHQGLLVGFRYWTVSDYQLTSIAEATKGNKWTPGPNTAICHQGVWCCHPGEPAPSYRCHCGFNLRAEPSALKEDLTTHTVGANEVILGACLAWGRCLTHGTTGIRAEHARPILLAYDPSWPKAKQGVVKGLAEDYDCRTIPVSYPSVEQGVCEPLLEAAREYGKLINELETDTSDR